MSTPAFCNNIGKEQHRIRTRCEEIEENMTALENERKAMMERSGALDVVRDLYVSSQQTVDDALTVQARLSATDSNLTHQAEQRTA